MLILSRKRGQRIRISDDITIEVRYVAKNKVVIGIDAPPEVKVLRSELLDLDESETTE